MAPGYPHHIILRGNNRSLVFITKKDRYVFLKFLREIKKELNFKIYGYCLMPNHIHLIIEPSTRAELSRLLQSLGRRYVQYFNKTHQRTGTLWEGRYKSSVISKDTYLLACLRYIDLNPVMAKIVKDPSDYKWSSFPFRSSGKFDGLLDYEPIYKGLGNTESERQQAYRRWVREGMEGNLESEWNVIRDMTQRCGVFGKQEEKVRIEKIVRRKIILRKRGRPRKK